MFIFFVFAFGFSRKCVNNFVVGFIFFFTEHSIAIGTDTSSLQTRSTRAIDANVMWNLAYMHHNIFFSFRNAYIQCFFYTTHTHSHCMWLCEWECDRERAKEIFHWIFVVGAILLLRLWSVNVIASCSISQMYSHSTVLFRKRIANKMFGVFAL